MAIDDPYSSDYNPWGDFTPEPVESEEDRRKREEEERKTTAPQQANYDTRDPFMLETGQPFNYGAAGSPTEAINKQNPTAALDKPYVQEGDTGGYLAGTGVTLGQGTSKTADQAQKDIAAARAAGVTEAQIAKFVRENGLQDSGRIIEGFANDGQGSNDVVKSWSTGGVGGSGNSSLLNDLYAQLRARMSQSLDVNASDPNIATQLNPYRASIERQRRDYLSGLAERGAPTQNLAAEQRMSSEKAGQAVGSQLGTLVGNELTARRQEIADAIDTYAGLLSAEEERALRLQLAEIDADLQRMALEQDASQFDAQLGLDAENLANYWDYTYSGGNG